MPYLAKSGEFDTKKGNAMKHIRSHVKQTVLHNKWNDAEAESNGLEVHNNLSDSGGIFTNEVQHLVALDCGHYAEPAGLCSVCERILCPACMLMCASCAKPIGKCHATQGKDGAWYCCECRAAQKRRSALRLLLSLLIRFKDENDV